MANHIDNHTAEDITGSGVLGIIITYLVNNVMPFAVHTISAIVTGLITTTIIFFFQKWLRSKFK